MSELDILKIRMLALEDAFGLFVRELRTLPGSTDVVGVFVRNLDSQVSRRFPANIPDTLPGQAEKRAAYANALKEIKDSLRARQRRR